MVLNGIDVFDSEVGIVSVDSVVVLDGIDLVHPEIVPDGID